MHNPDDRLALDTASRLVEQWTFAAPGGVTGTPAVVDGVVYFGDWSGWARAVNAADGSVIWEHKVTDARITASMLVTEEIVYVAAFDADLIALDRRTGETLWSAPIDDRPDAKVLSSPVLADDLILVGIVAVPAGDYHLGLVALDAEDGHERWRRNTDAGDGETGWSAAIWSTAAVALDRHMVFIGTGNTNWREGATDLPDSPLSNGVLALEVDTGELIWMYRIIEDDKADLDVGAAPNLFSVGGRDVVGIGGKSGEYALLDRATGDVIWKTKLTAGSPAGGVQGTAAVDDGRIYVASNEGLFGDTLVFALDAVDGAVLWETRLASPNLAAVALGGGVLFVTTSGLSAAADAGLHALDASTGELLSSHSLPTITGGAPSVADGMVFVGSGFGLPPRMALDPDGALTAFGLD